MVRSVSAFLWSVFFSETLWAMSMRYGEEIHVSHIESTISILSGYILASLVWSSLMTSVSDWRILGAYSIGISNSIVIFLTTLMDDEPLSKYMPSNIERIATISKRSDNVNSEETTTSETDNRTVSIYRSCEEQVSTATINSDSKVLSMMNQLFISLSTLVVNGFAYMIIYGSRDQNCWWRRYGKVWCFCEKSATQLFIMIMVISIRFTLDLKDLPKSMFISSILSMIGIASIAVNRMLDSDQMLDDDLFSYYLNVFGLFSCLTSGLKLIWYVTGLRSPTANVIWATSTALAWSLAPVFNFWFNNDHTSREKTYLCGSFLIVIINCLNNNHS